MIWLWNRLIDMDDDRLPKNLFHIECEVEVNWCKEVEIFLMKLIIFTVMKIIIKKCYIKLCKEKLQNKLNENS